MNFTSSKVALVKVEPDRPVTPVNNIISSTTIPWGLGKVTVTVGELEVLVNSTPVIDTLIGVMS